MHTGRGQSGRARFRFRRSARTSRDAGRFGGEAASLPPCRSNRYVVLVYVEPQNSVSLVFSGRASEQEILELAESHSLSLLTNEARHAKMLPQTRSWKLDPAKFQTNFGPESICYVGRLKDGRKAVLQIATDPKFERFTAELIGALPK